VAGVVVVLDVIHVDAFLHPRRLVHVTHVLLCTPEWRGSHPNHYFTYKEMSSLPLLSLPSPDQHQPSFINLNIGRCPKCLGYSFSSKAEKQRHCRIMHGMTKLL
jgi:hypothetical protein